MISALLLIFSPDATWQRICRRERGVLVLLLTYLVPLFILLGAAEGYSLIHFGRVQVMSGKSLFLTQEYSGKTRYFTTGEAVVFESAQVLLLMALVVLSAQMVCSVGRNFRGRPSFLLQSLLLHPARQHRAHPGHHTGRTDGLLRPKRADDA